MVPLNPLPRLQVQYARIHAQIMCLRWKRELNHFFVNYVFRAVVTRVKQTPKPMNIGCDEMFIKTTMGV